MATKKKKTVYPKVTVGTHLTVTEHEDGRTELVWDDEQLLKEVQAAIASVKKPAVKAKSVKKYPEEMKRKPAEKTVRKVPAMKVKAKK